MANESTCTRAAAHFLGQIRLAMVDLGITQTDIARRLGVSRAWVCEMLSGQQNLTLRSMERLAAAIGCDVMVVIYRMDISLGSGDEECE